MWKIFTCFTHADDIIFENKEAYVNRSTRRIRERSSVGKQSDSHFDCLFKSTTNFGLAEINRNIMRRAIQVAEKNRIKQNEMKQTFNEGVTMNRIMLLKTMNAVVQMENTLKSHGEMLKSINEKICNN